MSVHPRAPSCVAWSLKHVQTGRNEGRLIEVCCHQPGAREVMSSTITCRRVEEEHSVMKLPSSLFLSVLITTLVCSGHVFWWFGSVSLMTLNISLRINHLTTQTKTWPTVQQLGLRHRAPSRQTWQQKTTNVTMIRDLYIACERLNLIHYLMSVHSVCLLQILSVTLETAV